MTLFAKKREIQETVERGVVFLLIFSWVFSPLVPVISIPFSGEKVALGFDVPKAEAAATTIRQEINILDAVLTAAAGEVRAQLYVAHDVGYLNIETFKSLKSKAEECSKLLSTFIKGVKSSPHAGLQRKTERTKQKQDAEDFLRETRVQLSKIHPHLYAPDGAVKV